jgi:hypothetical protein
MSNPPRRLTLGGYSKQVASQAAEAEPLIPHSCEHCDKLVVRLPDVCSEKEKEEGFNAPIEGLCRTLIFDSVGNGCLFLEHCRTQIGYMEPEDVDDDDDEDDAGDEVGEEEIEGLYIEDSEEDAVDTRTGVCEEESDEESKAESEDEGDKESDKESDEECDGSSDEGSDASGIDSNSDESHTDDYDETYSVGAPDDTIYMRVKISSTDEESDQETLTKGRHPNPVCTAKLIHLYDPLTLGIAEGSDVPSWLRPYRMWRPSGATIEAFSQARSWYQECHKLSSAAVLPNPSGAYEHCQPASRDFMKAKTCIGLEKMLEVFEHIHSLRTSAMRTYSSEYL